MTLRRSACLLLVLCLLPTVVLGELASGDEDDEDFSLFEFVDLDDISYDDVPWEFPIDLYELTPNFIRLANKHMFVEKDYVAGELVTLKTRKVNKDGTTNGGVRKASSGTMKLEKTCAAALV